MLAEDSHEILSLIFLKSNENYLRLSSAAAVIGALRVSFSVLSHAYSVSFTFMIHIIIDLA